MIEHRYPAIVPSLEERWEKIRNMLQAAAELYSCSLSEAAEKLFGRSQDHLAWVKKYILKEGQ